MDFDNRELVKEMDVLNLVAMIRYLDRAEKERVLNIPFVKDKLRKELLYFCTEGDTYRNFRWLFDIIDVDEFFNIFDYNTIHNSYRQFTRRDFPNYSDEYKKKNYDIIDEFDRQIEKSRNRHLNEYKLFVCLMEKNKNKTIEYILSDNNLFREFMLISDNMYSIFGELDYEYIARIVYKLEEMNLINIVNVLQFLCSIGSENQKKLLDLDIKDETLINIIPYFNTDVVSYFFENDKRAVYLFDKFTDIVRYVNDGVKFNREILLRNSFFDKLKSDSFIAFRRNINVLEKNNDYIIIEKKVNNYCQEIIKEYDFNNKMFKIYVDIINNPEALSMVDIDPYIFNSDIRLLFMRHKNYDENDNPYFDDKDKLILELREITSKKISEVVVDALFCDNIYNVWLNIKEMLRYNDKLSDNKKVLDKAKVEFYKLILDFDNIECDKKIEIFNKFYNKNISVVFYDDLRKLKDVSYDMIKKELVDLSKENDKLVPSKIDGVSVYDLRDSEYMMLVRAQYPYRDKSNNRRNCYSIISNDNSDTYGHGENNDMVIYGYNSFDNDTVLHMLEQDAFSSDLFGDNTSTRYVNRIMTAKELANGSSWYSEIELVNLQNNNMEYDVKKPDFIVAYDDIRYNDLKESKRLNIPIVVIRKTRLNKNDKINTDFDSGRDVYVNDFFGEKEQRKLR